MFEIYWCLLWTCFFVTLCFNWPFGAWNFLIFLVFFSPFLGKRSQTSHSIRDNTRYQLFQTTGDYSREDWTKNIDISGIFLSWKALQFIPPFLLRKWPNSPTISVFRVRCKRGIENSSSYSCLESVLCSMKDERPFVQEILKWIIFVEDFGDYSRKTLSGRRYNTELT